MFDMFNHYFIEAECVNLTSIGSDNGLSLSRRQAIT